MQLSFAESSSGCNNFAALAVNSFLVPTWNPTEFGDFQADLAYVHEVCGDHLWCWSKEGPHTSHTAPDHKWQQICWWPKSGTGWCGCAFQISLGDAYLTGARFHPSRVSLCPALWSIRFTFWCQNHESLFGTYKKWNTFEQVDAAIYNIQIPTWIWSWCLLLGGGLKPFHFYPIPGKDDQIWRAYFSDGFKPPTIYQLLPSDLLITQMEVT